MICILIGSSLGAVTIAGCVAVDLVRERKAAKARIERAVRPVYGKAIIRDVPRFHNRLGED